MALEHRLKRLEQRVAPAAQHCVRCGLPLPGASWEGVEFRVGWHAPGEPEEPPCPACGQKPSIRIELDRAG